MKLKNLLLCAVTLLIYTGSSMAAKHKYKLMFTVKGWENKVCYFGFYYGGTPYITENSDKKRDSAIIDSKGHFQFSADSLLPGGVYFVINKDKRQRIEFLVDKEQEFSIEADTADIISSVKVKGSEENALFYAYQRFLADKYKEMEKYKKQDNKAMMDSIPEEIKTYTDNLIKQHADMFLAKLLSASKEVDIPPAPKLANGRIDSTFRFRYFKSHYFDYVDFTDGRLVRSPVLLPKIKFYLERLTAPEPDSIIAAADYLILKAGSCKEMFRFLAGYIADKYETSNVMGMDAVFVHMVKKYFTPEQAFWISASQLERLQERATQLDPILLGKHAPELVLPDTENVMQALDSVKARYTIVYFWDYDCIHCQRETPKLISWYNEVKDKYGVQVYAVEGNEKDLKLWKKYIVAHNLTWINVTDMYNTSNFRYKYDVITTPTIYVLDENKHIIAKKINVEDLDKVIKHDMQIHSRDNK